MGKVNEDDTTIEIEEKTDLPDLNPEDLKDEEEIKDEDIEKVVNSVKGEYIDFYKKAIASHPVLSRDENDALAKKYRESGDIVAREKLILHNLRLVIFFAKRYMYAVYNKSVQFEDLIQWGNIGLMRAIEKYDYKIGKFSVYAGYWIKQQIHRSLEESAETIRKPSYVCSSRGKLRKVCVDLQLKLDRTPTFEEISAESGISISNVADFMDGRGNISYSLDEVSIFEDTNKNTNHERFPDLESISTESTFLAKDKFEEVSDQIVNFLSMLEGLAVRYDKKVRIFKTLYSLDKFSEEYPTLKEVSKMYDISGERVRQVKEMIWKYIKYYYPESGLDERKFRELLHRFKTLSNLTGEKIDYEELESQVVALQSSVNVISTKKIVGEPETE